MHIVLYEDQNWGNLQPLSLTRPIWELRCGIMTLVERIRKIFPGFPVSFICRDYLVDLVKSRYPDSEINTFKHTGTLFLNARVVWDDASPFEDMVANTEFYAGRKFVGGLVKGAQNVAEADWNCDKIADSLLDLLKFKERLCGLFKRQVKSPILEYPWDLVSNTIVQIPRDLKLMDNIRKIEAEEFPGINIVPDHGVFTDGEVNIMPGVVFDTSEGPVYLGDGVKIMPNAVIQGPAAIGADSTVKIGAKIYEGTSIGPVCKIGGEIEETVIQGYSNKQHEGFLGHAVIGEWCNFGAGTENSDLKNNYTSVKVQIGKKRINSGEKFVGLFMGDHSKTGINTTFNTGSVVGVGSMAFGPGFQPRHIPSFTWSDGSRLIDAKFDSTIETAKTVLSRRNLELTVEEIEILKHIHESEKA